jgi:hypothetical protein
VSTSWRCFCSNLFADSNAFGGHASSEKRSKATSLRANFVAVLPGETRANRPHTEVIALRVLAMPSILLLPEPSPSNFIEGSYVDLGRDYVYCLAHGLTDGIRLAFEGSSKAPRCAQLTGEEFDYGSNQETRFGHEQCRQKSEECREDCRQEGRKGHGRQEENGDQEEDGEKRQPINGY